MARIYGRLGEIIRLLKTEQEIEQYGTPSEYDEFIEFDADTNAEVIAGLDTDWNSHAIADGQLLRSGKVVTINSPGTEWANKILSETETILAEEQKSNFRGIPNWATWTPDEGKSYIHNAIFSGQSTEDIQSWIDTNVMNLAQAKTSLKQMADAIITLRNQQENIAYAILLLRDIVVRRTN